MKFKNILFTLFVMLFLTPSVYAAEYEEVGNIYTTNPVSGKNQVYITNLSNPEIEIKTTTVTVVDIINNDEGHYKGKSEKVIAVKPGMFISDTNYNNPYSITYKNAGYYINDNGKKVDVNIVIEAELCEAKYSQGFDRSKYYELATVGPDYLWIESFELTVGNDGKGKRGTTATIHPGRHDKFNIKITGTDGKALNNNNLSLQWIFTDLDIKDYTVNPASYTGTYRESIKFTSGFDNKFYVRNGTVLARSDNNTKYSATEATGNDKGETNQQSSDYSGVVGYQTSNSAVIEWWGSNCGTELVAVNYAYPTLTNPVKYVDEKYKKRYKQVDETFSYTVKQFFPITVAGGDTLATVTLTDTFDNAIDISNIKIQVFDDNDNDVTKFWSAVRTPGSTTRTIKLEHISNSSSGANINGTYKFKFSNLKVREPDSSHASEKEDGVTYKVIPNQATVTITTKNGSEPISKTTNTVNVLVTGGDIKLTKEVVGETTIKNPKAGDVVKYKFTIKNTGKSKLTNVTLEDRLSGFRITSQVKTTLEAGEETTATGEYTLKQEDIVNGKKINNAAVVTAKDPNGDPVQDIDDVDVTIEIETAGQIKLTKEVVGKTTIKNPKVGDIVKYKFTIKNVGKGKLTNVVLTDKLLGFKITSDVKTTLDVNESISVTGEYALKQEDIINGKKIKNAAIVTAEDPNGDPVQDIDDVDIEIIEEITNPQTGGKIMTIFMIELAIILSVVSAFIIKKRVAKEKMGDE